MDNFNALVAEVIALRTDLPGENGGLALDIAKRAGGGRGWRVFPCHETHKIIKNPKTGKERDWIKSPYADLCPNGKDNATKDPAIIAGWWRRYPGALVGILCDENMLVLDLDVGHKNGANGIEEFSRLNKEKNAGSPVNCGVVQKTQSGGRHLFFALPPLPNGYKIPSPLAPGIDVKANNSGYVCTGKMPGGGGYEWLTPYQNYLTGLCYPPLWIVQMIAQANQKPASRREYDITDTPDIERVRTALGKIDRVHSDDYTLWIKVGMALHSLPGDGLALWHEFSKQSAKYDPEVLNRKWQTFKRDISIGYIFNLAKGK